MKSDDETTAQLHRLIELAKRLRRVAKTCGPQPNPHVQHLNQCLNHLRNQLPNRLLAKEPQNPGPPAMHKHIEILRLVTAVSRIVDAADQSMKQLTPHNQPTLAQLQRRLAVLANDLRDYLTQQN